MTNRENDLQYIKYLADGLIHRVGLICWSAHLTLVVTW